MATPVNPKQIYGDKKPNLSLVPPTMEIPLALAMMDGAGKYGPYNWRYNPVEAMTYIAAARRHLGAYLEGEWLAPDGVQHLGHVMACAGILLDAHYTGNLIDNRPPNMVRGLIEEVDVLIARLKSFKEKRDESTRSL